MHKRSLLEDISVQELRQYREHDHMTNREIAKVLECTPTTVYRYLGPDGTRGKHSRGGCDGEEEGPRPR